MALAWHPKAGHPWGLGTVKRAGWWIRTAHPDQLPWDEAC